MEGDELKELEDQSNKQLTNEEGKEGETKIGKISELYKIQHSPTGKDFKTIPPKNS